MALTRKLLKSMSIEDEKIEQIIDAHVETVDGLKAQIAEFQAKATRADELEKELESVKASGTNDDWKERFEKEHAEFETFKAETAKKAEDEQKASLYRGLLVNAGVDPRRIDKIMKLTDLSEVIVKDGKLENEPDIAKAIETEWSDFIPSTSTRGVSVSTPPASSGKTMTKADIMSIKDTAERQKAIADNINLFVGGQ